MTDPEQAPKYDLTVKADQGNKWILLDVQLPGVRASADIVFINDRISVVVQVVGRYYLKLQLPLPAYPYADRLRFRKAKELLQAEIRVAEDAATQSAEQDDPRSPDPPSPHATDLLWHAPSSTIEDMRDIFWYSVSSPGADGKGTPQSFEGPETASNDDIIAAVAYEADLPADSRVMILLHDSWSNLRAHQGPHSGDLTLKIVDPSLGAAGNAAGSAAGNAASNAAGELLEAAKMMRAFMPMFQAMSIEAAGLEVESRSSFSSSKRKALGLPADPFKLSLYQYYFDRTASACPSELMCMVTGLKLPAHLVVAAHLLRRSKPAIAATQWSVGNVDSVRNGVLWAGPIEEAWHRQEIAFLPDGSGSLVLTVLTDDLWAMRLQQLKRHKDDHEIYGMKTFGDYDGSPLLVHYFAMPYTRAFLNQAVCAVNYLEKGKRLREGVSLNPAAYEVASDFDTKPDVERWVAAMLPKP